MASFEKCPIDLDQSLRKVGGYATIELSLIDADLVNIPEYGVNCPKKGCGGKVVKFNKGVGVTKGEKLTINTSHVCGYACEDCNFSEPSIYGLLQVVEIVEEIFVSYGDKKGVDIVNETAKRLREEAVKERCMFPDLYKNIPLADWEKEMIQKG